MPSTAAATHPHTPPPTDKQVAELILRQNSPSQAYRVFRWATHHPSFRHVSPSTFYSSLARALLSFRRPTAAFRVLLSVAPSTIPDSTLSSLSRSFGPRYSPKLLDLSSSTPCITLLNSILNTLVSHNIDEARKFFRNKISNLANEKTYGILMKGLCKTNRISDAFKLLKFMKNNNSGAANSVIYNTLLHALCRNGKVGRARSLLNEIESPSSVTFDILISAYCAEGNSIQALVMLENCFGAGLVPNTIAMTKLIELLCEQGRGKEAVEVLERVEKNGGKIDVVAYNTLIKGFCKVGKPNVSKKVLKEMEMKGCFPNVQTYNALIEGFSNSGDLNSAIDFFEEMRSDGVRPNFETFDLLIRGLCSKGMVEDGLKILRVLEEDDRIQIASISPYNSVLYGLYKENRFQDAYDLFDRMFISFPRVIERSMTILQLCKQCKIDEAHRLYIQMMGQGDIPNAFVYAQLIEGLCSDRDVKRAFNLMNEMVERRFFPVSSTFNALIQSFCEEGCIESACKFLEEMLKREYSTDAGSYNPIISALGNQRDTERATGYLEQMIENGVTPDLLTWNAFLESEALWIKSEIKSHVNKNFVKLFSI